MRAVRVRVADALDDGHLALVVQALQGCRIVVDAKRVVDRQHLVLLDDDFLAGIVIMLVGVRHQRVHEVIAAGQLHHDQSVSALFALILRSFLNPYAN